MKMKPFDLEIYFAKYEFSAPHLLCSSDCDAMSIGELLSLQDGASEQFQAHWLGYTEASGNPHLRDLVAGLYETMKTDNTLILSGAQEGITLFANCVLQPDDHVIVMFPAYQSLYQIAEDMGCNVTRWTMQDNDANEWALDIDFLRDNICDNTRAIFINTPHNPTGFVLSETMLEDIISICREHDLYLFCDEVYRGLELGDTVPTPAACDRYEKAISLGVMSKAFGLAGLRIGWVASQDKNLLDDMLNQKFYTTICNSAPSEFLAITALQNANTILTKNRVIIETNINHINRFIQGYSEVFCWTPPQAGSIAFPRLKLDTPADKFCVHLVETQGVMLLPSTIYDYGHHHFRLGLGRRNLPDALEHFSDYVETQL